MGIEPKASRQVVAIFFCTADGEEHCYKIYTNKKTQRNKKLAKKHARMRSLKYGLRFYAKTIWFSEDSRDNKEIETRYAGEIIQTEPTAEEIDRYIGEGGTDTKEKETEIEAAKFADRLQGTEECGQADREIQEAFGDSPEEWAGTGTSEANIDNH